MLVSLKNNPKIKGLLAITLSVVLAAIVILPISVLAKGKIVNAPHQSIGGGISTNWAGYVVPTTAASGAVSAVSGGWIIPAVTGSGYSAIWVGMDGYSSNSAEQIGTEQDIINGKAQYYAWFEMYPNPAQKIDQPVNAGDIITASVQYTNGSFVLTLQDNNWPTAFSITETSGYTPQRNSAEWIIEAPSTARGILPLADFDSIIVNNIQATIGDKTGALSNWMPVAINMGNPKGEIIVQTNSLNAAGNSFTASYVAINSVEPVTNFTNPDGQGHNSGLHGKSAASNGRHLGWAKISGKSH